MRANELRLGNLINYQGNYAGKTGITELDEDLFGYLLNVYDEWHLVDEIPITDEWLVRFGMFEKQHHDGIWGWSKNYFSFINESQFRYFQFREDSMLAGNPIKYVHQLQNLCFILTGQELTLINK